MNQIEATVQRKLNAIIDPKTSNDHDFDGLNFVQKVQVNVRLPCRCTDYTDEIPIGQCVNNLQKFTKICDKDTIELAYTNQNQCNGTAVVSRKCENFEFGLWSEWLDCSKNCGIGETARNRTCTAMGSLPCPSAESCDLAEICVYESKSCEIQKCVTCADSKNHCDNQVNTECIDITLDHGEVMVRSKHCFTNFVI